jgi:prophage DNA circulation protein
MFKIDALEAAPIVVATLDAMLIWAPTRGRPGSDLRTAVGDIKANLQSLLINNTIGPPLVECFELARLTGATLSNMNQVHETAAAQTATLPGALSVKHALIELALAIEGKIIADMTFVSRQDVELVKQGINEKFAVIEEEVADEMETMTYQALISLHAAITFHLYETARPLPEMLRFQFGISMPTLMIAQRLYADASRADELRQENKVVHPAFMRSTGRALSQ